MNGADGESLRSASLHHKNDAGMGWLFRHASSESILFAYSGNQAPTFGFLIGEYAFQRRYRRALRFKTLDDVMRRPITIWIYTRGLYELKY